MARTYRRYSRSRCAASGLRAGFGVFAAVLALVLTGCAHSSAPVPATVPAGTSVVIGGAVGSADEPSRLPAVSSAGRGNPFAGARLYVDPMTAAATALRQTKNDTATTRAIARIASQPVAYWAGGEVSQVRAQVAGVTAAARAVGALPLLVAYNIPDRDCAGPSGGGATDPATYRAWIEQFAAGIGAGPAVVVLEPDALANIDCLTPADQQIRYGLLAAAVKTLTARHVSVYLDGGNSHWQTPAVMAARLTAAGVAGARGFALNVSNFNPTAEEVRYGGAIDNAMNRLSHFVVDTSRNGVGAAPGREWCNPPGRALGRNATITTGSPLADAFLWIKRPGESDGTCGGGPPPGDWWTPYAVGLANRAPSNPQ
ncbi:MAG: glycoside hydrolase family 6 protein [Frankia sp.]